LPQPLIENKEDVYWHNDNLIKRDESRLNPKPRSDIEKTYEVLAVNYDRVSKWNPAVQADRKFIVPFVDPHKNDVILEIGCGTGRFTLEIAKKCSEIIGIDFSAEMLKVARKKSENFKNVQYRQADVRDGLQFFEDQSFDKVVCPLIINHIHDIASFFQETFRLLKMGGILVFDDVNPDSRSEIKPEYRDLLYENSKKGKKIFYIHSIDDIVHNLHRAGFEIEQVKFLRVDGSIKRTLTKKTFARNKGRTFGMVVKARK
jgi:ubiquinone/menaquinone biosynthesis C-methylase UbiE